MSFLKDFRDFAVRGNVVDMAVGIIVGAAFTSIVKSLVDDVIMPPIGMLLGNVDFSNLFVVLKQGGKEAGPYATIAQAHAAGAVTLNYGLFINTLISFMIVALTVFILVKAVKRAQQELDQNQAAPADTRECPYCCSTIKLKASRCPNCTSSL